MLYARENKKTHALLIQTITLCDEMFIFLSTKTKCVAPWFLRADLCFLTTQKRVVRRHYIRTHSKTIFTLLERIVCDASQAIMRIFGFCVAPVLSSRMIIILLWMKSCVDYDFIYVYVKDTEFFTIVVYMYICDS